VTWLVSLALVLLAGAEASTSRSLELTIRPLGPWCEQHGVILAEIRNTGRTPLILGMSPPSDRTDWPGSYSYAVFDRSGKKVDEYGVLSTFDCVRPPGQTGPVKCEFSKLTLPAGGSLSWTVPLLKIPKDHEFDIDFSAPLSAFTRDRFTSIEVRARRRFLLVNREAGCVYAVGV
jgi:hypothetical protein